jgi:MFS family permease
VSSAVLDPHPRLRDRSVRALLSSVFFASCANTLTVTALGKFVFDLTHRELDLGLLGLVEFLPAFALVVVTGTVADRFDRRKVAAIALLLQTGVMALLAFATSRDDITVGVLLLIVVLFGSARAFVAPSKRSLPADTVHAQYVPWFMVRYSATWQIASIAGPVVAGFTYVIDPIAPFVIAAVFYALAALTVLRVRIRHVEPATDESTLAIGEHDEAGEVPKRGGFRAAFDGFRFVRRQPVLLGVISLDLFAVLFGGAVALLPAIAEKQLHVGAVGLGWLRAAVGIGAGITTLYLARRPIQNNIGRVLLVAVAIFGLFTIVLGLTSNYVVALLAVAILSGADAISVFIRSTLVPLITPPEMRGRVLALENVFIGASNELGAFESGVAGHVLGASGAVIFGGFATIAIAGIWAFSFPALRNIRRFPGHVPTG